MDPPRKEVNYVMSKWFQTFGLSQDQINMLNIFSSSLLDNIVYISCDNKIYHSVQYVNFYYLFYLLFIFIMITFLVSILDRM